MAAAPLDLPPDWERALARAAEAERVVVLGPTDSGKSTFIHALAALRPDVRVIDLDPGQKMIGAPGTAAIGRLRPEPAVERFVFLGSTAIGSFRALAEGAADLAEGAGAFAANTSGYVAGAGARLQAMTLAALRPDLVVALAPPPSLEPLLGDALRLMRAPQARRKTESYRRAVRQAAFATALAGAVEQEWEGSVEPGPLAPFEGAARPICCLADAAGEDMAIGVLLGGSVWAPMPPRPTACVRLGKMWAEPGPAGWKLLYRLAPSWVEER